jgi:hypothetical protein
MHNGATWVVDEARRITAEVEAREWIEIPAGRISAWRIRIRNLGHLPQEETFVWYGDAGYLGMRVDLRSERPDGNGGRIITTSHQEEWLEAATLAHAPEAIRCSLTGGGCLNEEGGIHRQSTFAGNVGFPGDSEVTERGWTHIDRDGATVRIEFQSQDARLVRCRPEPARRCAPHVMDVRVYIQGTGTARLENRSSIVDANFQAEIVDRDGACGSERDFYAITVRAGHWIGRGDVLFETSGELDCGNLQVDESRPGPP